MQTFRAKVIVSKDGKLIIKSPFHAGEKVDVIIMRQNKEKSTTDRYPLRGKPFRYEKPFDSVAEDDWDVLR